MFQRTPQNRPAAQLPPAAATAQVGAAARVGQGNGITSTNATLPAATLGCNTGWCPPGMRLMPLGPDPNPTNALAQPCNIGTLQYSPTNTTSLTFAQTVGTPGLYFVATFSPDCPYDVAGLYVDPQMADEFSLIAIYQSNFNLNFLGSNAGLVPLRLFTSWDTCCAILTFPTCITKQAPLVVIFRGGGGVASFIAGGHFSLVGTYGTGRCA